MTLLPSSIQNLFDDFDAKLKSYNDNLDAFSKSLDKHLPRKRSNGMMFNFWISDLCGLEPVNLETDELFDSVMDVRIGYNISCESYTAHWDLWLGANSINMDNAIEYYKTGDHPDFPKG